MAPWGALVFAQAVHVAMTVIVFATVAFGLSGVLPLAGPHRHGG